MSGFLGLGVSKKVVAKSGGVYVLTADDVVDGEFHITEGHLNKRILAPTSVTDYYISVFLKPIGKPGDVFTIKTIDDVETNPADKYGYLEFYDDDYSGNIFIPQIWGHWIEYDNKEVTFLKEGEKWRRIDESGLYKIDEDETPKFDNKNLYFDRRNIHFNSEFMFIESDSMSDNGSFSNRVNVIRLRTALIEFYQKVVPAIGYDVDLGDIANRFKTLFAENADFSGTVKAAAPVDATDLVNKQYFETNLPAAGISKLEEDLTPKLGGSLDVNGQSITNAPWIESSNIGANEVLIGQGIDAEGYGYAGLSFKHPDGGYFHLGTYKYGETKVLYFSPPNDGSYISYELDHRLLKSIAELDASDNKHLVSKEWVLAKIPASVDLAAVDKTIVPDTDDAYDIGSVAANFNKIYCNRIGKDTRYIDTSSNYFDIRADGHYLRALGNLVLAITSSAATFYQKIQSSGNETLDIGSTTNRFRTLYAKNLDITDGIPTSLENDAAPKLAANLDANGKMFLNVGAINSNYIVSKFGELKLEDTSTLKQQRIFASSGTVKIAVYDGETLKTPIEITHNNLRPYMSEELSLGNFGNEFKEVWADDVHITNGATGSFTSQDGKTVTVTKGIITSIV